jgi:hypothetical protein
MAHASSCEQWLERVTQGPKHAEAKTTPASGSGAIGAADPDPWGVASLSEAEKLKAIECLLTAENNAKPAAFSGANRFDISQTFAQARVNLAALYAISYIYSGHYDHAAAVALRGENASSTDPKGNYVTKASAIHKAYAAYRSWFAKVRTVGLANARQANMQPLQGTGLSWY